MADSIRNTRIDAYTQFKKWLSEQPYWLQDAAYRIYHGLPIDDKQIQAYVDMCISETKKEKPAFRHIDDGDIEANRPSKKMVVLGLSDILGVNALASDAKLEFSPEGVTVVYGLNGAGKSGFMRIFKQVSESPFEEPIQPNVFTKATDEKTSCIFRICVDEQEKSITCNLAGKTRESFLAGCDVFDTRISNAYINNSNNPSYQPFVFTVLSELSSVADRINHRMQDMVKSITPTEIVFPKDISFQDDTKWVQVLNAETVIPVSFTEWTEDQTKRLAELPLLLDTQNVTQRLQILRTQLQVLSPILNDLTAARDALSSGNIKASYDQYEAAKAKLIVAEKLFADSADELDKISLSSRDWKALWGTAKRYYEAIIFNKYCKHFGEEGSVCPLCHQEIIGSNVTRFQNVNDYINGSCSEDSKVALGALQNAISTLCNRSYNQNQVRSAIIDIIGEEQTERICGLYSLFASIKGESEIEKAYSLVCSVEVNEVITILSEKAKSLAVEISELDSIQKDEKRISMQQELAHLQCCKWIYDSMVAIRTTVSNLQRKKNLADAMPLVLTNKITLEANRLAESLITEAYIERFTAELKRLAPKIKVKLEKAASRKGNSPYRITLDTFEGVNVKTEDILSEGEQRIVALAAFFADATGRDEHTPLIIDDPISSLDLNYECAATQRIVELARDRQVIVFTHRISMLTGIEEVCQRLSINHRENYIRSTSRGKGVPDFADVYRGDVKKHLSGIQQRIIGIKKLDHDSSEYLEAVGKQCQQFRICIERSVEDILLQGMVHRFERRIMTNGKLTKLTRITDDDCQFVDSMMTKYSFTEHSQPADSPPIDISIDELNVDISTYIKWIADYRKRMQ